MGKEEAIGSQADTVTERRGKEEVKTLNRVKTGKFEHETSTTTNNKQAGRFEYARGPRGTAEYVN